MATKAPPTISSVLRSTASIRVNFSQRNGVDLVCFGKGERKDDRAPDYLGRHSGGEGVLFVDKAQEKARVLRTVARTDPMTGLRRTALAAPTAMPNAFCFYLVDEDFGPLLLKFRSSFPYNDELCLNGHEFPKRHLARQGVAFEPLDNGLLSCAGPDRIPAIVIALAPARIDALPRKWLARLPHPFTPQGGRAGERYKLSILQAELSLTQVFDRPQQGRVLLQEILRENLDIGRPDRVQLVFDWRVTKLTPSGFRTHVLTSGTDASLHFDYKRTHVKQHFKEGRALRTETAVNNACDFGIGRKLKNLDDTKTVGFQANRRLLRVERLSHDCTLGVSRFADLHAARTAEGRPVPALRFGDPRVLALLGSLLAFRLLPEGFDSRQLRESVAAGPQARAMEARTDKRGSHGPRSDIGA